jgi:hypothetical protein
MKKEQQPKGSGRGKHTSPRGTSGQNKYAQLPENEQPRKLKTITVSQVTADEIDGLKALYKREGLDVVLSIDRLIRGAVRNEMQIAESVKNL